MLIKILKNSLGICGLAAGLLTPGGFAQAADSTVARQQQYLKESLKINRSKPGRYPMTTRLDKTWDDWQKRTGELPPDFSMLPSEPFLPDPLTSTVHGTKIKITTQEQWAERREWIKKQFEYWISGSIPPAPRQVDATILEDRADGNVRVQMLELSFGDDRKATLTVELLLPEGPGPFPVYMTQWNHRDWAQLAVRRGYIGCVYAAADSRDDTDAYRDIYPEYEFSQLMRRAWGASRVVDYLLTRPEVNPAQIAITGHSRNGKQSLWAAAFDDRIGAVISSSSGTGGMMPWRYSDPQFCNETLDSITSIANVWFHPRLRYFFGREDKLPIDQNLLLAVIAPRPLLLHHSIMEHQMNPWASEQCYQSVKTVYDFLGSGDRIGVRERNGEHAVAARDQEQCIDFLDIQFGRKKLPWENRLLFHYDFAKWAEAHNEERTSATGLIPVRLKASYSSEADFAADKEKILANLQWLLGEEPPLASPKSPAETVPSRIDWIDSITGRPVLKNAKEINVGPYSSMGQHMPGKIYYPTNKDGSPRSAANGKIPVVLYMHQYAYAHGYAYGYNPNGGSGGSRMLFQGLVDRGYAVMAIDMFGFGTRLKEALYFDQRYPEWSKMGKMVRDVSDCIDAVASFDMLDPDSVYLLGDTIGGAVGLMAAAKDERIAAVAAVAAFSPWRDSNERYQPLRAFSHLHGFIPRLGFFADAPGTVPVDFPEIIACIAPRPLLVVAPTLDRHSDPSAVSKALVSVSAVYRSTGSPENLHIQTPLEINRITPAILKNVLDFYDEVQTRKPKD